MDPKELFKKVQQKSEAEKEYLFALQIDHETTSGAVWGIQESKAKVFGLSPSFNWQEEGQLLSATDEAYSAATEKAALSEENEPQKVIFGLPFPWVKGEKILPEKLSLLKKICQSLDLKPVGFVVIAEAIIKYLKALEGVPLNAILVSLASAEIELTLVRLGKIVGRSQVKRSENLGDDVAEALSRIKTEEVLPARIILYGQEDLIEEKKDEILDFPWLDKEEDFNFLHLPKTEVMASEFSLKAVALAGGTEVAKAEGIEAEIFFAAEEIQKAQKEEKDSKETAEESAAPAAEEEGEKDSEIPKESEESDLDFDFVADKPVGPQKELSSDQDSSSPQPLKAPLPVSSLPEFKEETAFTPEEKPKPSLIKGKFRLPFFKKGAAAGSRLSSFKSLPAKLIAFPKKIFASLRFSKKPPVLGIFALGLIFLLVGAFYYFLWALPRAEVILYVSPQLLEEDLKITLDSTAERSDVSQMIIPASLVSQTIEDSQDAQTTGTKIVGEKATGEVTLYNRTSEEKNLDAGTLLTGPDDLQFSLNEEVTIPAETTGPDYTKVPGKATISVTAVEIGSEANLASGTEFEVGKYSQTDLIAKNDSAFSGGSSREIRVVAKTDQEKLLASLLEKLQNQALEALNQKISSSEKIVTDSLTQEVLAKNYNHQVDDEVDQISLSLKVKFEALAYQDQELNELIEEKIRISIPSGYEFKSEETEVSFKLSQAISPQKAEFDASFKAKLLPQIDVDQIRRNLKGKKPEVGEFYLTGLTNLADYEVYFQPKLPEKLKTFPRITKNISIEIRSQ